jgi:hypothetical protein
MSTNLGGRGGLARAWLGAMLLTASCLRVAVESQAPEPSPTRSGATTVWILAWGLATTPKVTAACGTTHVYKSTVRTNFGGFLLGLVTLGFVVPAHVEYVCAAEAGTIEGQPPAPPPPPDSLPPDSSSSSERQP